MRLWASILSALLVLEMKAMACPACAVTSAQKDSWQTFWILSVMGFLPFVVAAAVWYFIVKIGKNDKTEIA